MGEVIEEKDISFIVSYRDRKKMLDGFLESIQTFYPTSQIIISEQCNSEPFLQGQLLNLGYKYSSGEIVVFMDVDLRFRGRLDIGWVMSQTNHPFIAYNLLFHCDLHGNVEGIRAGSDRSTGGCCVFTRRQFEESEGYSNLIVGWGADDDLLSDRVGGYARAENSMLHVRHERLKSGKTYGANLHVYQTRRSRDKRLDGFRQTIGRLRGTEKDGNVVYLKFDEIGVVPEFAYENLLRGYACH
jgi:glycosyltransferase involved in cell wall biosynthesis